MLFQGVRPPIKEHHAWTVFPDIFKVISYMSSQSNPCRKRLRLLSIGRIRFLCCESKLTCISLFLQNCSINLLLQMPFSTALCRCPDPTAPFPLGGAKHLFHRGLTHPFLPTQKMAKEKLLQRHAEQSLLEQAKPRTSERIREGCTQH